MPEEVNERKILFLRGQKVMLDEELATLYGAAKLEAMEQKYDFQFKMV